MCERISHTPLSYVIVALEETLKGRARLPPDYVGAFSEVERWVSLQEVETVLEVAEPNSCKLEEQR